MSESSTIGDARPAAPFHFAGFWQRIGAALIDFLLLGILGWIAVRGFENQLMTLGQQGRFLGFPVALLYFGLMNSRLAGGATLGKHAVGIRVVGRDGAPVGVLRALLRAAVYTLPYYCNGYDFSFLPVSQAAMTVLLTADALLVFGVGGAEVYLYLFNWRTRQVAHDLVAGTFVVRQASAHQAIGWHVARVHLAVVSVLLLLALAGVPVMRWYQPQLQASLGANYATLQAMQTAAAADPDALAVGVSDNWSTFSSFATGTSTSGTTTTTTEILVRVIHRGPTDNEAAFADRIAARVLKISPDVLGRQKLRIAVVTGYDIGLFSSWSTHNFVGTPADWRGRLAGRQL
jgi:uncharacterized RDD family membrane protein YckC